MTTLPVPLAQVLNLLPAASQGRLELLGALRPGITRGVTGVHSEPQFSLEVQVGGRLVRTGGHRRIAPGLVDDLAALLEPRLGRLV